MAKGQKRSNREAKKPKAKKPIKHAAGTLPSSVLKTPPAKPSGK